MDVYRELNRLHEMGADQIAAEFEAAGTGGTKFDGRRCPVARHFRRGLWGVVVAVSAGGHCSLTFLALPVPRKMPITGGLKAFVGRFDAGEYPRLVDRSPPRPGRLAGALKYAARWLAAVLRPRVPITSRVTK